MTAQHRAALRADDEIGRLRAAIAAAEAETLEQARLNGMGAERELALLARAEKAERERDAAREALHRINDLAGAYPEDAFTPLTDDEVATIASAMSAAVSNGSDRMHASWGRHLMSRTGEIARAALTPARP